MKWILIILITAFCSAQVTLTEEESKKIAINVQNLQVEVDSLKNIVNLQNKLIYIHKEVIFSDSTLTVRLEEKIDDMYLALDDDWPVGLDYDGSKVKIGKTEMKEDSKILFDHLRNLKNKDSHED